MLIGIDVDETCADLISAATKEIRKVKGYKDYVYDGSYNFIPKQISEKVLSNINVKKLKAFKGVHEAVEIIRRHGDIVFITRPSHTKTWYYDRVEWLKRQFLAEEEDVIFAHKKELVDVDILVDDSIDNILRFCSKRTQAKGVLIAKPYNLSERQERVADISMIVDSLFEFATLLQQGFFEKK